MKSFEISILPGGKTVPVGPDHPLLLLAGPCALESGELGWRIAKEMKEICERLGISYVFKASFDKANRTSLDSFRGPGLRNGLRQLDRIRQEVGVPVVSDVHETSQMDLAADALDIIQIPARSIW
ncbi:MAG: 3-deoxy-8-phosphooctulonate synthase, partial [Candidatus Electrothrix sp. AX5]|nr:3-deoxy-8-phosphooctulonate synthase [Candidatus Electrothrix sp. AX5]